MKRVKNVRDTIYLLIFCEPKYAFEISKILYGRDNKRVFAEIRDLLKNNWIEESSVTVHEKDKRAEQRKYYQARVDPIINYIEKNSEILLGENDMYILRLILNSQAFRYLIKKHLPKNFKESSIDAIEFILTYLDILFIISTRNKLFRKFSKGIKKIGDYEKAIDALKKDKKFIAELPELTKILFRQKDVQPEVKKHIPYLFIIPERLSFRHQGFSDFGKKHYGTTSISKEISKLMEA